jgi:hypothetical protein
MGRKNKENKSFYFGAVTFVLTPFLFMTFHLVSFTVAPFVLITCSCDFFFGGGGG